MEIPLFTNVSDKFLLMEFDGASKSETTDKITQLYYLLKSLELRGVLDIIPAVSSIGVFYDPIYWIKQGPYRSSAKNIVECIVAEIKTISPVFSIPKKKRLVIPVVYGGEYGEDLEDLAKQLNLNPKEFIKIHVQEVYRVLMIGFVPGFPYLGPLPLRLNCSRKSTPRARVPTGSVAIAAGMTGIYPGPYPGGWNLIGRTNISMFSLTDPQLCKLKVGDEVRFVSIAESEFKRPRGEFIDNRY